MNSKLFGTWQASSADFTTTMKLDSSGSASFTLSGSGSCSGTLSDAGLSWSSTATELTFSGTPSCSGQVTCGQTTVADCSPTMFNMQACAYTLSGDGNTLMFTCAVPDGGTGGSSVTFTRS